MGRILSQEEIDALLGSIAVQDGAAKSAVLGSESVVTKDFRRPERATRDQIRSLH